VGFAIGLQRGGLLGGLAAFIGFTLPSFIVMYLFATMAMSAEQSSWFAGLVHGLKLLAVVVVADATLSMFHTFCKNKRAISIMIFTATTLLIIPGIWTQMAVLVIAAGAGLALHQSTTNEIGTSHSIKWPAILLFLGLFLLLPILAMSSPLIALFTDFYQSGSLVFGGGHVVLPLLQQTLGESVSSDRFLTGYAAAQAVPGPMFTFASFLGADLMPESPLLGALLATLAVFLPGFLLVISLQGAWESLASKPKVAGAIWGINAAVVGLLMAALYQPVFISAVQAPHDMALVILGFFVLRVFKVPVLALVLGFILCGLGLG